MKIGNFEIKKAENIVIYKVLFFFRMKEWVRYLKIYVESDFMNVI